MSDKPGKTAKSKIKNSQHWRRTLRSIARRLADSSLPEITFIGTFILARWWVNSDFSYFTEVWVPIILFGLLASLIYYIYRWVIGRGLAAHLASLPLLYGLYNYRFVHDYHPTQNFLKFLHLSSSSEFCQSLVLFICMALLFGALGWAIAWLVSKYEGLRQLEIYRAVLFAIIFVFAIQIFRVGDRIITTRHERTYRYPKPSIAQPAAAAVAQKPDIYYLEYEDYTDAETLKRVYHYDETPLLNFLSNQGFVSRQKAYSNYPVSMSSIASTLSMNYLPEFQDMFNEGSWQTAFPYRTIINNPPITQILKQNGYLFDNVSSWWDFTRIRVRADSYPTKSYRLKLLGKSYFFSDLGRDIMYKSIFSPWLKKGIGGLIKYDRDRNPKESFEAQVRALSDIANRSDHTAPHFIFSLFMVPHSPYIYNADCSPSHYDAERNDNDADELIKYANQVNCVNSYIKKTVKDIKDHDPNAVVILQSDEGSYPKEFRYELTPNHYYNPINLSIPEMRQKLGILASYYMPGVDNKEVTAQLNSSVNVFRFVLNKYLGYNLPMLPDCHFAAGDKFSLYDYQLITDKLTGQPAPAECKKYE